MKEDFMRNMQTQMKYVMPVMVVGAAYIFSASIALYFVVSNLTMIAQEYFVKKHR
jgi:membrane protein insertase Oxa1/YidC/SpoIIIJ